MNVSADGAHGAADDSNSRRLVFDSDFVWTSHKIFRYPAKFHPPVARRLVELFSNEGDVVLDPFCGSGTLLVESLLLGRNCVGTDIDPLAVFVANAKTTRYNVNELERTVCGLEERLSELRDLDAKRDGDFSCDISNAAYIRRVNSFGYRPPRIPKLHHWFRNRVILQLCELDHVSTEAASGKSKVAKFLSLAFASIIRNSSNADPVPVSGLEVTAHMLRLEAEGRSIDPFVLFIRALKRNLEAVRSFESFAQKYPVAAKVRQKNAVEPWRGSQKFNAIITSPPYLSAVDYYRRHQLEMYWLGLVDSHADRLNLMRGYIGRPSVSKSDLPDDEGLDSSSIFRAWGRRLKHDPPRHRILIHYAATMRGMLRAHAKSLARGGQLVLVIGDGQLGGMNFPTANLLEQLAQPHYELLERFWYPLQNRYMSYSRKNGANINKEHVLVFKKARGG